MQRMVGLIVLLAALQAAGAGPSVLHAEANVPPAWRVFTVDSHGDQVIELQRRSSDLAAMGIVILGIEGQRPFLFGNSAWKGDVHVVVDAGEAGTEYHAGTAETLPAMLRLIAMSEGPQRVTYATFVAGSDWNLSVTTEDAGVLSRLDGGPEVFVMRLEDFEGGPMAAAGHYYRGAHVGALRHHTLPINNTFVGVFGPPVALDAAGRFAADSPQGTQLCPCTFRHGDGPRRVGDGPITFSYDGALVRGQSGSSADLFGADIRVPLG